MIPAPVPSAGYLLRLGDLMTRRAILHIGTEKTGTTSIQQFLARHRPWLNQHGFHYAKAAGSPNHTRLFGYAVSNPRLAFGVRTTEEQAALRAKLEADLQAEVDAHPDKTFLFSNEHLHSRVYQPGEVERLRDLLARFFERVDVLVYLRRQDQLAVSLYSTLLKAGTSSRELLVRKPVPGLPDEAPEQALYYDYQALIARWAAGFGPDRVIVRRFPADLVNGSIIDDVCHVAGLPAPDSQPDRANESLTPEFQEYLRLINPYLKVQHGSTRGEIIRVLSELGKGGGRLPSKAAAKTFLESFRASNEAVRQAHYPEATTLFDTDFSRYPDEAAEITIGAEAVARITAETLRHMATDLQKAKGIDIPSKPPVRGERRTPDQAARLKAKRRQRRLAQAKEE